MIFNLQTCRHHQSSIIPLNLRRAWGFYQPLKSFNVTFLLLLLLMDTTQTLTDKSEHKHRAVKQDSAADTLTSSLGTMWGRRSLSEEVEELAGGDSSAAIIPTLLAPVQSDLPGSWNKEVKTGNRRTQFQTLRRLSDLSGCRNISYISSRDVMWELSRLRVRDNRPQLHLREI